MPKCYLCNRDLIEKNYYEEHSENFNKPPALNHKEHIIQNGIHGKLKVEKILCSDCGGKLSSDIDSQFCNLFNAITEQLKHKLVNKDHGKNNKSKILKGYLYTDNSFNEKIDINYKYRSVSPENPFYEFDIDSNKLKIFANKKRSIQFQTEVIKELKQKNINTNDLIIEVIPDIENTGHLGLFFTEGIADEQNHNNAGARHRPEHPLRPEPHPARHRFRSLARPDDWPHGPQRHGQKHAAQKPDGTGETQCGPGPHQRQGHDRRRPV